MRTRWQSLAGLWFLGCVPRATPSGPVHSAPSNPPEAPRAAAFSSDERATATVEAPAYAAPSRFEEGTGDKGFFPRGKAEAIGLDGEALDELVRGAEESRSAALVVVADHETLVERYPSGADRETPLPLHSLTKAVVSLVFGTLVADGTIASLNQRLGDYFPEWSTGDRARVTLRHALSHTAGLASEPSDLALYARRDTVAYARSLSPSGEPGRVFAYSNTAVQLLAGVVEAAAKAPIDRVAQARLFGPLGIESARWERDAAGNCLLYAGLSLVPRDLARIGALMADRGQHAGTEVVPRAWFDEATRPVLPDARYGLLFELYHDEYEYVSTRASIGGLSRAGLDLAQALRPMIGGVFRYREEFWLEAGARLTPVQRQRLVRAVELGRVREPYEVRAGRQSGFGHSGTFGQYLMVFPARQLVIARLVRGFDASRPRVDFEADVLTLLRRSRGPRSSDG